MSDWYVNVNAPLKDGELYTAIIDTNDPTILVAATVTFPDLSNCTIECTKDPTMGRSRLEVDLTDYEYEEGAGYRTVKVSALLDGEHKGTESTDVQDD